MGENPAIFNLVEGKSEGEGERIIFFFKYLMKIHVEEGLDLSFEW